MDVASRIWIMLDRPENPALSASGKSRLKSTGYEFQGKLFTTSSYHTFTARSEHRHWLRAEVFDREIVTEYPLVIFPVGKHRRFRRNGQSQ